MEDLFKLLMYYSDIFSANKNIAKILKTKLSKARRKKPRFFQNMPLKLRYHKRPFVILVCTFMEVLFKSQSKISQAKKNSLGTFDTCLLEQTI